MTPTKHLGERTHPSWRTRFWAVVRYEMLWNIRKKKFIGIIIVAFILDTIYLALPVFFSSGQSSPDYAVTFTAGNLAFFLFALATGMNSISGEFESGTIVSLLTKPVSRTMVFLGKLFAAFIMILVSYTVLFAYTTIGAIILYGPQNNLQLVPLALLGNIISTFIWVAIILAVGALSKSSLIAALGAFGLFLALFVAVPIVSAASNQPNFINYVPGTGTSGILNIAQGNQNITIFNVTIPVRKTVSTGTDSIGPNLVNYVLYPSTTVNITKTTTIISLRPGEVPQIIYTTLYSEPIAFVLLKSIAVASTYILVFLLIAWYAFKRTQILE